MISMTSIYAGNFNDKIEPVFKFVGTSGKYQTSLLAAEVAVFSGEVSNMDEAEIKGLERGLSFVLTDCSPPRLALLFSADDGQGGHGFGAMKI